VSAPQQNGVKAPEMRILGASLLGISLYLAVALAERAVVRWAPEHRHS